MSYIERIKNSIGVPRKRTLSSFLHDREMKTLLESITPRKGMHYSDGAEGKPGRDGRDGKDGKDANETIIVKTVLQKIPIEDIVKEVMGRLKLPKEESGETIIEKLKGADKKKLSGIFPPGMNKEETAKYGPLHLRHGGGDIVYYADITNQITGATRVFTIPKNRKVTAINYSSAPFSAWRVTTDYVISGKNNVTLTFDSSIPYFVVGQTLTINYIL